MCDRDSVDTSYNTGVSGKKDSLGINRSPTFVNYLVNHDKMLLLRQELCSQQIEVTVRGSRSVSMLLVTSRKFSHSDRKIKIYLDSQ